MFSPHDTFLFLICLHNTGSTLLSKYLEKCRRLIPLSSGEAIIDWQTDGFGPLDYNHGIYRLSSLKKELFENMNNYDWEGLYRAWTYDWLSQDKAKQNFPRIFFDKSPGHNMYWALQLEQLFPNSKFILFLRHPYAFYEGIKRRLDAEYHYSIEQIISHWVYSAKLMRQLYALLDCSIVFNYEMFTEKSTESEIQELVQDFVPELDDLNFGRRDIHAHNFLSYENTLPKENLNKFQIKNLTTAEIDGINALLDCEQETLQFWGYEDQLI